MQWFIFASALALSPLDVLVPRFDSEGDMLAELVAASIENKLLGSRRYELLRNVADKRGYSREVIVALVDVLFSDSNSAGEFVPALVSLVDACVKALKSKCGLCFGIIGIVVSVYPGVLNHIQIHTIQTALLSYSHSNEENLADMMFSASMDRMSTLGTVVSYYREVGKDESSNEYICETFTEALLHIARDSAGEDVMSDFVAPGPVSFADRHPPRNFISADILNGASSEGLDYYIRAMKDNAASLTSAMMFGGVEVFDLFDSVDESDLDEMLRNAEDFANLNDEQIAEDLIATINSVRYNAHVIRYNEALMLVASKSPAECAKGVEMLAQIISSQSLLVKVLFFLMKTSFYVFHDTSRSLFIGLMLNAFGVRYSGQYVRDLHSTRLQDEYRSEFVGNECAMMKFLDSEVDCAGFQISLKSTNEQECLDACIITDECEFAVYRTEKRECAEYRDCRVIGVEDLDQRVYLRATLVAEIECFDTSKNSRCFENTHLFSARTHRDADAMHWLMYFYVKNGSFDEGFAWAKKAAILGDPEGMYQLATLHSTAWEGHEAEWLPSLTLFENLVLKPIVLESTDEGVLGDVDDFQKAELLAVQEIAEKIGIHDVQVTLPPQRIGSLLVQRTAGLVGIFLLYSRYYVYLVARIVTLLALVVGLAVLVRKIR